MMDLVVDPTPTSSSSSASDEDDYQQDQMVTSDPTTTGYCSTTSLAHRVVFNPVILQQILEFLSTDEIKECRLVCKDWLNIGSSQLGKRTLLSINELCSSRDDDGRVIPLPVNPKLLKNLKYDFDDNGCIDGLDDWMLFDNDFVPFVTICADKVEELRLELDRYFLRTLKLALENINFSNLSKISIHEHQNSGYENETVEKENMRLPMNLPVLPKIKSLKISSAEGRVGNTGPSGAYPYQALFQELINNSPNLEKVEIAENFYPDLRTCSKLKSLDWRGYPFPYDDGALDDDELEAFRNDFSLQKLTTMVSQVKNSLQLLTIGSVSRREYTAPLNAEDDIRLELPHLPQLTFLSIQDLEILKPKFKIPSPKQLPALETLWLDIYDDDARPKFPNPFILVDQGPFRHVNSLVLGEYVGGGQIEEHYIDVARNFPNLTRFSVEIDAYDLYKDREMRLKEYLQAMSANLVKLQHLTIQIHFNMGLTKFMEALGLNEFKDLQTLTLTLKEPSRIQDDGSCNNFDKPFLAFPSIRFGGFMFRGSTSWKMHNFIRRHDCNVRFIN